MRRSPNDPREPQDQRLMIFLLLTMAVLMFSSSFTRPAVEEDKEGAPAQANAEQAEAEPGDAPTADPAASPGTVEAEAPAGDEPPAVIEEAPPTDAQTLTIGSATSDGPYRMLMTLSNEGAVVRRLELSSDEFSDIDNHAGSLGVLELSDAPSGGVTLDVVGPGTAAHEAGIRSGDVVTAGEPEGKSKLTAAEFADAAAFRDWLSKSKPKESVKLTLADKPPVSITLTKPALQLIRPESENILLHQEKLPEDYQDMPSLIVRLLSVGDKDSRSAEIKAANKTLETGAWTVETIGDSGAVFTMRLASLGIEVVKQFTIAEVPTDKLDEQNYRGYHFDFEVELRNLLNEPQNAAYELQGPNGLPIEGFWYANKVGRKVNGGGSWGAVGLRDVILRFRQGPVSQMNPSNIAKEKYDQFGQGTPLAYIGVDAQYFSMMMVPQKKTLEEVWFDYGNAKLATVQLDEKVRQTYNNPTFILARKVAPLAAAGQDDASVVDSFTVFAGPKRPALLAQYHVAQETDYALDNILYYGWFGPVAKVMLRILHTFYAVVHNYGLAIILLTVVVRLLMFPLSRKQAMNMVMMQQLKPEIDRLTEKYKNDMEKRNKAQQELFRKHNYNPMGGCLLMFIQLPIFLGLYRALAVDVELREASLLGTFTRFCSNLAAPDMFLNWSAYMPHGVNTGAGFFGLGPYFNLLPILTIVLFLLQQKLFMPEPTNEQAVMQQKMMKYMMGFMGFLFFKVPSGLCLYFIASSLWGIGERKLIPPPTAENTPLPTPKPEPPKKAQGGGGGKKKKRKR